MNGGEFMENVVILDTIDRIQSEKVGILRRLSQMLFMGSRWYKNWPRNWDKNWNNSSSGSRWYKNWPKNWDKSWNRSD